MPGAVKHAKVACIVSNEHPLALRREPEIGLVGSVLLPAASAVVACCPRCCSSVVMA
jgi:hypothetical protein